MANAISLHSITAPSNQKPSYFREINPNMPSHKKLKEILESNDLHVDRLIGSEIERRLGYIECVTLLGPRQIGKTTFAHTNFKQKLGAVYRDLEDSDVRAEVGSGRRLFEKYKNRIIILDEIQECEFMFKNIKVFIDEQRLAKNRNTKFLLFGSASLDVQRKAFSSLAGRVTQIQMYGILPTELIRSFNKILPCGSKDESLLKSKKITELLMFRGGMPLSLLAKSDQDSLTVRSDFIETYVQNDINNYGLKVDHSTLNNCLRFIASVNGTEFEIGTYTKHLKTTGDNVQNAIKALEQLLLIRAIQPWSPLNGSGVRVSKHTKVYVRDSGLLASLLEIDDLPMLLSDRHLGSIWEGFVIESVIGTAISAGNYKNCSFYRTHEGDGELDLILKFSDKTLWGIEIKHSEQKKVNSGNIEAASEVGVDRRLLIHNGTRSYDLNGGFEAMPLHQALNEILEKV